MNPTFKMVGRRPYISYNTEPWDGNSPDANLLRAYWYKKELESFLPTIATYSTPEEVAAIALAQLQNIEREIIDTLKMLAQKDR